MQLPEKTINANNRVVITRRLPVPGEVLVQRNQKVEALQVIAKADLPRRYRIVDVSRQLAQPELDIREVLLKEVGDTVKANEIVAASTGGLPFLRRTARAPVAGRIAVVGSGWLLLETERTTIELQAFINGRVTKIIPDRGAVIETNGAMITATCGFGGEAYGQLRRLVDSPFEWLQPEAIGEHLKNSILLGGQTVDEETLRAAEAAQVRGIIVGSIDASLLGLDPAVRVRVVATEGFGDSPMSPYTFGILGTLNGKEVSIRGTTPSLLSAAGGEPSDELPLVVTSTYKKLDPANSPTKPEREEAGVGSRVRITYGPLLGVSGIIQSVPSEPETTAGGVIASGAYVKIEDQAHFIPWANLELLN